MVTSLLWPLFWATWQNRHTFSRKNSLLIWSPVNTVKFFYPLVTVLIECMCNYAVYGEEFQGSTKTRNPETESWKWKQKQNLGKRDPRD